MRDISKRHEEGEELRFSRNLAVLHIGGVLALILVVLASVVSISNQHNDLAKDSYERLVQAGLDSLRLKIETVVRDYSLWDEAYAAVKQRDAGWLYPNVGTAVVEMGTIDLVVVIDPVTGYEIGWQATSPEEGETGLLPTGVVASALRALGDRQEIGNDARTTFAMFEDEPWTFTAALVQPFAGAPEGVRAADLPVQIHGHRLSEELLSEIGANLLIDDLTFSIEVPEGHSSIPLQTAEGTVIGNVDWSPPRPGARILNQIALPLSLSLIVVAAVAAVSANYAVGSARRLESALFAAQAADRSKTEFLSNVTHELRTPMNGIIGVAQLLEMTPLTREQRELLAVLSASADTQMALISDLLDLTRIEGGNRRLVTEDFAPAGVVQEIVEMIRPVTVQKNLMLASRVEALDGLTIHGDSRAFRQILTNLLGNAAKFTIEGEVGVSAQVLRGDTEAQVEIRVWDTGPGIAPEHQQRIFERFYQVDGTKTRRAGGTGLGLAISSSLAQMMGGRLVVQSTLSKGSTFVFSVALPLAKNKADLSRAA